MQASDWVNVFIVITAGLTVWVTYLQYRAKQKINSDSKLKDSFEDFKSNFLENQNRFANLASDIEKIRTDQATSISILKSSLENTTNMLIYRIELLQKEKDMLVSQFKNDIENTKEGNRQLLDTFNELKNQITSKLDQLLKEHYMCINKNEATSN